MSKDSYVVEKLKSVESSTMLFENYSIADYNFGGDVFLRTCPDRTRIWMQHLKIKSDRHEICLGDFPEMSVSQARHLAACNRKLVTRGLSPFPRKLSDTDRQFLEQIKGLITQADSPASENEEAQKSADVIPMLKAQKAAPLDLAPYMVHHNQVNDAPTQSTPKALFAAQVEILISRDEPALYEELGTPPTPEDPPEFAAQTRDAESEVNNAGAHLFVLAKALSLNTKTSEQKERVYKSCLALLDEHGPTVLDAACEQALIAGTSSLSAVVSIIRKQLEDKTNFQPNTPTAIEHENIRGSGYFN